MTDNRTVQRAMVSGSIWMTLFTVVNRLIGLVSTLILARLLVPEDFGIIAVAMSAYALLEIFTAFGFDVYLIQNQHATREDYDTSWTIKVLFYSLLAAIFFSLAGVIAEYFEEEKLRAVVQFLSLTMIMKGLENIKMVDFRKNFYFRKEFIFQVAVKISGFVCTVPLALILGNYWALVWGMIFTRASAVVISYVLIPYFARPTLSQFHEIFHFSKWLIMTNLLNFTALRLPNLAIGKIVDLQMVGVFSFATEIAKYGTSQIMAPVNRAIFPAYSKSSADKSILAKNLRDVSSVIFLLMVPIGAGISITSEYLVLTILGDGWIAVIQPLQVLGFAFALLGASSNVAYIFYSLNMPRLNFNISLMQAIVLVPLLIILLQGYGVIGAAYALLVTYFLKFLYLMVLARSVLHVGFRDLGEILYRPITATAIMYIVLNSEWFINIAAAFRFAPIILLVYAVAGASIYVAVIALLWRMREQPIGSEAAIVNLARRKMGRFFPKLAPGDN